MAGAKRIKRLQETAEALRKAAGAQPAEATAAQRAYSTVQQAASGEQRKRIIDSMHRNAGQAAPMQQPGFDMEKYKQLANSMIGANPLTRAQTMVQAQAPNAQITPFAQAAPELYMQQEQYMLQGAPTPPAGYDDYVKAYYGQTGSDVGQRNVTITEARDALGQKRYTQADLDTIADQGRARPEQGSVTTLDWWLNKNDVQGAMTQTYAMQLADLQGAMMYGAWDQPEHLVDGNIEYVSTDYLTMWRDALPGIIEEQANLQEYAQGVSARVSEAERFVADTNAAFAMEGVLSYYDDEWDGEEDIEWEAFAASYDDEQAYMDDVNALIELDNLLNGTTYTLNDYMSMQPQERNAALTDMVIQYYEIRANGRNAADFVDEPTRQYGDYPYEALLENVNAEIASREAMVPYLEGVLSDPDALEHMGYVEPGVTVTPDGQVTGYAAMTEVGQLYRLVNGDKMTLALPKYELIKMDLLASVYDIDFALMTDMERGVFNYYVNTGDEASAAAYYKALEPTLLTRTRNRDKMGWEFVATNDWLGAGASWAAARGANIASAVVTPMEMLEEALTGEQAALPNVFADYGPTVTNAQMAELADVGGPKIFGQNWAQWLYSTGSTVADMGLAIALGAKIAPVVGLSPDKAALLLMSGEASAQEWADLAGQDINTWEKLARSVGVGAVEYLTEKLPLEYITGKKGRGLLQILMGAGTEGAEEVIAELGGQGLDVAISYIAGHRNEIEQRVIDLQLQGVQNAEEVVLGEVVLNTLQAGFGGMLAGGALGGATNAMQTAYDARVGKGVAKSGNIRRLIELGLAMGKDTQSYQLAMELQEQLDEPIVLTRQGASNDIEPAAAHVGAETQAREETIGDPAAHVGTEQTATVGKPRSRRQGASNDIEPKAAHVGTEHHATEEKQEETIGDPEAHVEGTEPTEAEEKPTSGRQGASNDIEPVAAHVEGTTAEAETEGEVQGPEKAPEAKQEPEQTPQRKRRKISNAKLGQLYQALMAETAEQYHKDVRNLTVDSVAEALENKGSIYGRSLHDQLQGTGFGVRQLAEAIVDAEGDFGRIKGRMGKYIREHFASSEIAREFEAGSAEWTQRLREARAARDLKAVTELGAIKATQGKHSEQPEVAPAAGDVAAETDKTVATLTRRQKTREIFSRAIVYRVGDGRTAQADIVRIERDGDGYKLVINRDGEKTAVTMDQVEQVSGSGVARVLAYAQGRPEITDTEINEMVGLLERTKTPSSEIIAAYEAAVNAGYMGSAKPLVEDLVAAGEAAKHRAGLVNAIDLGYMQGVAQAEAAEKVRHQNVLNARQRGEKGGSVTYVGEIASREDVAKAKTHSSTRYLRRNVDLTPQQDAAIDVLSQIARTTGVNVALYMSKAMEGAEIEAPNGWYEHATRTIFIDLNAGINQGGEALIKSAMLRVAGHELTHYIENTSDSGYTMLRKMIRDQIAAKGQSFMQLVLEKARTSQTATTREAAEAEVIADACEMMLSNTGAIRDLAIKEMGLAAKIVGFVRDFVGKIRRAMSGIGVTNKGSALLTGLRDGVLTYAKELQATWDAALVEAADNYGSPSMETGAAATTRDIRAAAQAALIDKAVAMLDTDAQEAAKVYANKLLDQLMAGRYPVDTAEKKQRALRQLYRDMAGTAEAQGLKAEHARKAVLELVKRVDEIVVPAVSGVKITVTPPAVIDAAKDAAEAAAAGTEAMAAKVEEAVAEEALKAAEAIAEDMGDSGSIQGIREAIAVDVAEAAVQSAEQNAQKMAEVMGGESGTVFAGQLAEKAVADMAPQMRDAALQYANVVTLAAMDVIVPGATQEEIANAVNEAVEEVRKIGAVAMTGEQISQMVATITEGITEHMQAMSEATMVDVAALEAETITAVTEQVTETALAIYRGQSEPVQQGLMALAAKAAHEAVDQYVLHSEVEAARGRIKAKETTEALREIAQSRPQRQFSLRGPVEKRVDGLVAVHNMQTEHLLEMLRMGGLSSPSIALIAAGTDFESFGDASVVFDQGTIDPEGEYGPMNAVYSADAWTPSVSMAMTQEQREQGRETGSFVDQYGVEHPYTAEGITGTMRLGTRGLRGSLAHNAVKRYWTLSQIRENMARLAKNAAERSAAQQERSRLDGIYQRLLVQLQRAEGINGQIDKSGVTTLLDKAAMRLGSAGTEDYTPSATEALYAAADEMELDADAFAETDLFAEAAKMIEDYANAPTEYFEAKPARTVTPSEIVLIAVPAKTSSEIIQGLRDAGINVQTYDTAQDRARVVQGVQFSERQLAPDTEAFRRWFEGSQIVNEDGTPRVMYHTTSPENGEFWTFDYSKALVKGGRGHKALGQGIYFASEPMGLYGSRVIPVYLSIKNPLYVESVGNIRNLNIRNHVALKLQLRIDEVSENIQDTLREYGYDGVILEQHSKNRTVLFVVAFDSTQVKSATDNVGTFDPGNPDIRYSERTTSKPTPSPAEVLAEMKPTEDMTQVERDLLARYQKLLKEKQTIADEIFQLLQKQKTATETEEQKRIKNRMGVLKSRQRKVDQELFQAEKTGGYASLMARYRGMVQMYYTSDSVEEAATKIRERLSQVIERMKALKDQGGIIPSDELEAALAQLVDKRQLNQAAKIIKERWNTTMSLEEIKRRIVMLHALQMGSDREHHTEYIDHLSEFVRDLYAYGGQLTETAQMTNDQEAMAREMAALLEIAEGASLPAYATDRVKQIMERLHTAWEQNTERTVALQDIIGELKAAKYDAYILKRDAMSDRTRLKKIIAYYGRLNEQDALARERDMLERNREYLNTTVAEWFKQKELAEERRLLLSNIRRKMGWMDARIRREQDKKAVPERLKPVIDEAIRIMLESNEILQVFRESQVKGMRRTYEALKTLHGMDVHQTFKPDEGDIVEVDLADQLDQLRERLTAYAKARTEQRYSRGTNAAMIEETNAILKDISDLVSTLWNAIVSTNTIFFQGNEVQLSDLAGRLADDLARREDYGVKAITGEARELLRRHLRDGNLTPVYFFRLLDSPVLTDLNNEFSDAQLAHERLVEEAVEAVAKIQADTGYWQWKDKAPMELTTWQEYLSKKGKHTLQITVGEAMSIYATWLREQHETPFVKSHHMQKGGFNLRTRRRIRKKGKQTVVEYDGTPHKIGEAEIAQIEAYLTPEMKEYVSRMVAYMSGPMAELGNEVSMRLFGIRKFTEDYYFPMRVQADVLEQSSTKGDQPADKTNRIAGMSPTKRRVDQASKPLEIGDFTEVVSEHIMQMILYNTYAIPIENLNKVLNQTYYEGEHIEPKDLGEGEEDTASLMTLRGLFAQKYGKGLAEYLSTYIADLNGGVTRDPHGEGFLGKLIGLRNRSAVMASLSVAFQQPWAIIRACYVVDPKYFVGVLSNTDVKAVGGQWKQLLKYSGAAKVKERGGFDMTGRGSTARHIGGQIADNYGLWHTMQDFGKAVAEGRKGERLKRLANVGTAAGQRFEWLLGKLPEMADKWAWARIWEAVKREVADAHKGIDPHSEEFLELAGKRFDEVANLTQVYDSTLVRSQNMRSKTWYMKMGTSFMAEPTLTANMMMDAERTKDPKKMVRAAVVFYIGQVVTAAAAAIAYSIRDDDEEKPWLEKYLDAVGNNLGGWSGALNPLALLPFAKDMLSLLDGYDVERADMEAFADLLKEGGRVISGYYKDKDPLLMVQNAGGALATFTGIPLKNIVREGRAIGTAFKHIFTEQRELNGMSMMHDASANFVLLPDRDNAYYYNRLYNSMVKGDTDDVEALTEYLTISGKSETTISNGVKGIAKQRVLSGEMSTEKAIKFLLDNGLAKDEKEAYSTVDGWVERDAHKDEEGYSYSAYNSVYDGIAARDHAAIKREVETLMANGYLTEKGTMKQQLRGKYRDQYRELYKSNRKEFANLQAALVTALVATGYTTRAEALEYLKGWLKD